MQCKQSIFTICNIQILFDIHFISIQMVLQIDVEVYLNDFRLFYRDVCNPLSVKWWFLWVSCIVVESEREFTTFIISGTNHECGEYGGMDLFFDMYQPAPFMVKLHKPTIYNNRNQKYRLHIFSCILSGKKCANSSESVTFLKYRTVS